MTQIGFVGLGKMGGNMVRRIRRDSDHAVVAFDFDAKAVRQAVKAGATGAASLAELVRKLQAPRMVWIMVPAGDPTEQTVQRLARLLEAGDTIIDGGNSRWTDDKRRSRELRRSGIHYVDVGVSGGVWGLEVGYCMMVGGPQKAVRQLAPILDVLAPPTNEQSLRAIGSRGWLRFGPSGAGHYVKMVHNGVEYGLMQSYAEGFDVFDKCEYELDNAKIAHLWGQGSVVRSWLCELAARAFEADGNDLAVLEGYTADSGEGRWTIADATGHDVPTPVITASLYSRMRSRGNGDYADRVLAALRNQFGGHAVVSAPAATAQATAGARAGARPGKRRKATAAKAARKQAASKAAGKRATSKPAAKRAAPKAAGKRPAPKAAGKRAAPKAAGKRPAPKAAGKRATSKPAGKRAASKAAGKRPALKARVRSTAASRPAKRATAKAGAKRSTATASGRRGPAKAPARTRAASKPRSGRTAARAASARRGR
jgi:6-phosphogluconate dehydrogenase